VGNDIGCGMSLWQTDLPKHKWSGTKLQSKLGDIDGPLDVSWDDRVAEMGFGEHRHRRALGTIGGGNHFAEVQCVDETYVDSDVLVRVAPWLNPKALQLLVHSGSRGLGEAILRSHVDVYGHAGLLQGSEGASMYMNAHDAALLFAQVNRKLIAMRMLERWRADGEEGLTVHHNFVEKVQYQNEDYWLHRKGATPSTNGLVVIPGSRGDYSYLVEPVVSEVGLWSLAHGAGRKWMRSDCIGKLGNRYRFEDLIRTDLGSTVVCNDKNLMFEEAPQAYKSIGPVVDSLVEHGLVRLIARLKPVLTYKTYGGCGC
jgi:release factor H-coupled RctB family protein